MLNYTEFWLIFLFFHPGSVQREFQLVSIDHVTRGAKGHELHLAWVNNVSLENNLYWEKPQFDSCKGWSHGDAGESPRLQSILELLFLFQRHVFQQYLLAFGAHAQILDDLVVVLVMLRYGGVCRNSGDIRVSRCVLAFWLNGSPGARLD